MGMSTRGPSNRSVHVLLDESDDFRLCNAVFLALAQSDEWTDVSRFDEIEKVVVLVWHSMGLIENGGFFYLLGADFIGDPGFIDTAASYRKIEAEAAYGCFQEALACFPRGCPHEDLQARREFYEALPQVTRDRVDRLFWSNVPEIKSKLAGFIRANRDPFERALHRRAASP